MKRRVAVLMGGVSEEREVSLRSGEAVAAALASRGHEVVPIDLAAETIDPVREAAPEVVFVALHGRFGEDGEVQAMLDGAGLPYTGSDPHASRAAMDKMASKCFFITHDVPTPPFRLVTTTQSWGSIEAAVADVGLPLVVKPLRQGSSVGVSIAGTKEEVVRGLSHAFTYGHHALLERRIRGREFTVGVLDDRPLPVVELRPRQPFFNYEAKYRDPATEFIVEPDLASDLRETLQEIALAAHRSLGCRHMSRVDMMLESDGCPYVLEVNTIPGCTDRSLYPRAARAAGIEFPELCERIVELALRDAGLGSPAEAVGRGLGGA